MFFGLVVNKLNIFDWLNDFVFVCWLVVVIVLGNVVISVVLWGFKLFMVFDKISFFNMCLLICLILIFV